MPTPQIKNLTLYHSKSMELMKKKLRRKEKGVKNKKKQKKVIKKVSHFYHPLFREMRSIISAANFLAAKLESPFVTSLKISMALL